MAENPYVNKVETADGTVIMDISGDTATPNDVLNGATFHDRSGAPHQGAVITHNVYDGLDSTSTTDALSANQGKVLYTKTLYNEDNSTISNLNSITKNGAHKYAGNSTNAPTTNGGMVFQMTDDVVNQGMQFAYPNNQEYIAVRYKKAGTWSSWDKFAFNSRKDATITMASNFGTGATYDYESGISKINNVATLHLVFWTTSTLTRGSWTTIGTIPAGFRPFQTLPCIISKLGSGHATGNTYDGRITSDGNIQLYVHEDIETIPGRAVIQTCYMVG